MNPPGHPRPIEDFPLADAEPLPHTSREAYIELAKLIALPCPEKLPTSNITAKTQKLAHELLYNLGISAKIVEMSRKALEVTWPPIPGADYEKLRAGNNTCTATPGEYSHFDDEEMRRIFAGMETRQERLPTAALALVSSAYQSSSLTAPTIDDPDARRFIDLDTYKSFLHSCLEALKDLKDDIHNLEVATNALHVENQRRKGIQVESEGAEHPRDCPDCVPALAAPAAGGDAWSQNHPKLAEDKLEGNVYRAVAKGLANKDIMDEYAKVAENMKAAKAAKATSARAKDTVDHDEVAHDAQPEAPPATGFCRFGLGNFPPRLT
ncbi:uncharacterized protein B0I36DRAFT_369117 [Microdochium trichocladiopsis]|uniref:Uncharacterized protein n=1 Tax=Microdochium trichocladiopsis TaxID=1682393 RepID=A0A9P8XRZ1_9PEZI|nr:uncharacterized protein B0I36DRAFT_369117 [Microdochium trichocladiopsis]KAH7014125.1 hypothetical protein B0I36DRAFT_369117 [Microdochium trichocladiopsis]